MTDFDHGGNIFTVARTLGVTPDKILDFSASINPLGVGDQVIKALQSSFSQLAHYPDTDAVELTAALAAYHQLLPTSVTVANGSTELIYLLPRLIQGRRALIIAPAFSEYAKALARHGWQVVYHELDPRQDFHLSVPTLATQLAEGFDVLFVCNPGNPTGTLLSVDQIQTVYALCRGHGTFLVLDEAFMDFTEAASAKHIIAKGGGIVLRSMTKFFAIPGLRLGYALGSPEVIAGLRSLREPWSVNTPAQRAGLAALAELDYQARTRQLIDSERDYLSSGLEALKFTVYPSAANYLLVEMQPGFSATELRNRLLSRGILIRDCSNFVGLGHGFFRVAVRSRGENTRLLQQLEALVGSNP